VEAQKASTIERRSNSKEEKRRRRKRQETNAGLPPLHVKSVAPDSTRVTSVTRPVTHRFHPAHDLVVLRYATSATRVSTSSGRRVPKLRPLVQPVGRWSAASRRVAGPLSPIVWASGRIVFFEYLSWCLGASGPLPPAIRRSRFRPSTGGHPRVRGEGGGVPPHGREYAPGSGSGEYPGHEDREYAVRPSTGGHPRVRGGAGEYTRTPASTRGGAFWCETRLLSWAFVSPCRAFGRNGGGTVTTPPIPTESTAFMRVILAGYPAG